ncbi:hypothetical protein EYZ11_009184 [Aspergillus tanneri]|uniref:Uncharacterized protein n=1 Tax=Aspergillus tanneri TaxID=1220188 RepID=A0A4S3J8M6_9EURO|nr:hypothetical protein EYZ11_009184 [Aspergillus tanneri]
MASIAGHQRQEDNTMQVPRMLHSV